MQLVWERLPIFGIKAELTAQGFAVTIEENPEPTPLQLVERLHMRLSVTSIEVVTELLVRGQEHRRRDPGDLNADRRHELADRG